MRWLLLLLMLFSLLLKLLLHVVLLQRLNLLLLQLLHEERLIVSGEFGECWIAGVHWHAPGPHRCRSRRGEHRVHHGGGVSARRRGERVELETLLQLLDVLLQHHHVVRVLL